MPSNSGLFCHLAQHFYIFATDKIKVVIAVYI
jgi:hypothetical protein